MFPTPPKISKQNPVYFWQETLKVSQNISISASVSLFSNVVSIASKDKLVLSNILLDLNETW